MGIADHRGSTIQGFNFNTLQNIPAGSAGAPSIAPNGDPDTGFFFPSANTWAIANGGTETVRGDGSNNVLFGTTSVGIGNAGFRVFSGGNFSATIASRVAQFNRLSSAGDVIQILKDSVECGVIGATTSDHMAIGNGSAAIRYNSATSRLEPYNVSTFANNNNIIDIGDPAARFKDLYLGGGVYLGGTGAANKLDDYEEGTWTPVASHSSASGTVTYTVQDGEYTKIGRMVYVSCIITINTISGHSGDFWISGLPFQVADALASTTNHNAAIMQFWDGTAVDGKYIGFFQEGTSQAVSFTNKSDLTSLLTNSDVVATRSMRMSGYYIAA